MQVEEVDGGVERRILIGLVVSTAFISRLLPFWEKDCFRSRWSNILASWCVDFAKKRKAAPNKQIIAYFERWVKTSGEESEKQSMERFLSSLSEEYDRAEELDVDALLEQTENYLTEVKLERIYDQGRQALRVGDLKGARELTAAFRPVQLRVLPSVNVLADKEAQRLALERKFRRLITYPGPVGEFFGNEFSENSFVAFAAPPKGMKSWLLTEVAWMGMMQRRRVAYFQVGDMTLDQVMCRFQARAAGRPLEAGVLQIPTGLQVGQGYIASVERSARVFDQPLSTQQGIAAYERLQAKLGREYLRLQYHPAGTVSMLDIRSILESWAREGWFCQICVVDYLENTAPIDRKADKIQQFDDTWLAARQISETGPCVVTAHQTNKEGFKARLLTRSHFRGSLKVLAHVTCFCGINQTDEEKQSQVFRLNFMVRREGYRGEPFSETRCCVCAGALGISRPIILSYFA
jgi:hypothetical protein